MKTRSVFLIMLFVSFALIKPSFCGDDKAKKAYRIPENSIQGLIDGLNSENKGVMIGSIINAGKYQVSEAVESLIKILQSDQTFDVKTAAVYSLYQIHNEETLTALKKVCLKNNCPFLKQTAEFFLNYYLISNPDVNVKVKEDYLAND
ncbi:MAG: HEAT repeat domain-containing protein [Ignavibacteriaceae bacterium]|nr:HEAT repeat domain-containing protein [Ignavibacteriaceae bacterium]